MDNELKERIGWIYENVDEIDSMPIFDEIREKEPEFNIKNDVKTDLITFIMYLMLESGEVSDVNTQFLKEYFDWDITKENLEESIHSSENELRSLNSEIPVSLHIFLAADNFMRQLYCMKIVDEVSLSPYSSGLAFLYECVGNEFLTNNPDVSESVKNVFDSYIQKLYEFTEENLIEV